MKSNRQSQLVSMCIKEKMSRFCRKKLKEIIGKADCAYQKLFKGVDMWTPMDISAKTVQTTSGHAVVVTNKLERQQLKEQFGKRKEIKLIETQPVSKVYNIVSRVDAGKPVRCGQGKMQEHMSSDVIWQCSRYKSIFQYRETFYPNCHSENKKTSHDPVWIDEIDESDATTND